MDQEAQIGNRGWTTLGAAAAAHAGGHAERVGWGRWEGEGREEGDGSGVDGDCEQRLG